MLLINFNHYNREVLLYDPRNLFKISRLYVFTFHSMEGYMVNYN